MWRVRPPRVELVIGADPHERSTAPTLAIGGALARCGVPARPPADAPPGQVTGTQLAEAYEKDRTARVGDRRDWPNKPDRRALVGRFLAVHTRWRRTRARSPRLLLLCLLRPLADVGLASQNRARVHQVVAGDAQVPCGVMPVPSPLGDLHGPAQGLLGSGDEALDLNWQRLRSRREQISHGSRPRLAPSSPRRQRGSAAPPPWS